MKTFRLHNVSNPKNLYQNRFINEYAIKCDKKALPKVDRLISRDLCKSKKNE